MTTQKQFVDGPAGRIAYVSYGSDDAPLVVMTHSILTAAMMWQQQAALLAQEATGWYALTREVMVIRMRPSLPT